MNHDNNKQGDTMNEQDDKCCIIGCASKAKVIIGEAGDPYTEWRVCAKHASSFDAVYVTDIESGTNIESGDAKSTR